GRDPRPDFTYVNFDKSVTTIIDLQVGMTLEGVATNIAALGVFVDIGVHQDGLIHISQLADRFVKNPADFVSVGQIIQVEVLEVDEGRKRISLKALGL
ncbi:S1 RNA-binding domain-containing protein, partial [Marinomonas agarivorans]